MGDRARGQGRPILREWEEEAKNRIDMLSAAILMETLGAYRARLDGREITVLGHVLRNPRGNFDTKPLVVLIDDDLFDRIDLIDEGATKARTSEEA